MVAAQRAGDPRRGRRDARRRGEDDGLSARRGALEGDERRVREALSRAAAGALDGHRRPEVRGQAGGDRGHRRAAGRPVNWPYPREPARGTRGMVVSGHPLASGAGLQALADGGTAVDAALAASGVLAVVRPAWCGPGGDGFALLYTPERGMVALNGSGAAPLAAAPTLFPEGRVPRFGARSVAV